MNPTTPPEHHPHDLKRSLNVWDMTLFTVSGILLMDTLAASAAIGVSSLSWWIIMGLVFFIPYGLISSEMGTTYPEQGGIYAWVRDNFGARWGTYVIWLYWINVALWAAATYVMFAGIFAQMFFPGMATTLGLFVLLTFVSNIATWSIGSNRGMAEAAADGELPAFFARLHPSNETPVGSALVMALIGTGILVAYGFLAGSHEDLFWNIYSAGGVLLLLPYLGGIAAFYRARIADPDRRRPFRVPGGNLVALLMAALCIGLILFTILLFMYVPGEGVIWPVAVGTALALVLGEVAIRFAEYENRQQTREQLRVEASRV